MIEAGIDGIWSRDLVTQISVVPVKAATVRKGSSAQTTTTIAMGAGMLPIAIGWGTADPSFRSPMAIAVIGGLITSTVLSLLVIPVVFTYVDDVLLFLQRLFKRLRGAT